MYLKNDTSPKPIYAILVNASDGSPITSGVAAYHIQGTTRTPGQGTLTHIANGRWAYVPTQAETNYDAFAIDFYHADAVGKGALVEVVTANQGLAIITADTSVIKQKTDAYLDATISSRAPANTALSNTVWTDAKAAYLDAAISSRLEASSYVAPDNASIASIKSKTDAYLDATVSSRLAASDYVAPDNTSISAIKSRTDAYLDAAVSSRLASSAYVAPDNASITAIKAKTDNLTFNEDNYVYAVGVGGSGGTDWTDAEKQQIRYRLGIDGTTEAPSTNTPHLGSSYADLDQLASHGDSAWATVSPAAIWSHDTRTITGGTVTTVNDKSGYRLSAQGVDDIWDEPRSGHTITGSFGYYLDAAISSRSTFNPNTDQVTVAINNDKTGYSLAPDQSSVIIGQVNNLGGTGLAAVAGAVWDASRDDHAETGTFGAVSEWAGGGSEGSDWTDDEKKQIRYRLGIDGNTLAPTTNAPHLGSNYSTLDDLAAHVSTRLAASAYTAPDNASISAIKFKTDKLTFDTNNYVYAIATNAITDWTDNEKKQIRYRLGIDGTTQTPSANTPHLGSTYSTLDDLAAHVSTRLAASAYTPPDNASITAIKTKTDQLSFDSGKVAAKVSDPVSVSSSDISAIVDGVWDELISQHTTTGSAGAVLAAASDDGTSPGTIVCSPVIYPLQLSTAPRTSGPSITWYTGEKPAASFVIKSTDLTTKDVVLSVFALANPQEVLLEAAGSVAYSEATLTSTVNISLDELVLAPSFAYRYILKNVTDDTVLASGPLYVISVPA